MGEHFDGETDKSIEHVIKVKRLKEKIDGLTIPEYSDTGRERFGAGLDEDTERLIDMSA